MSERLFYRCPECDDAGEIPAERVAKGSLLRLGRLKCGICAGDNGRDVFLRIDPFCDNCGTQGHARTGCPTPMRVEHPHLSIHPDGANVASTSLATVERRLRDGQPAYRVLPAVMRARAALERVQAPQATRVDVRSALANPDARKRLLDGATGFVAAVGRDETIVVRNRPPSTALATVLADDTGLTPEEVRADLDELGFDTDAVLGRLGDTLARELETGPGMEKADTVDLVVAHLRREPTLGRLNTLAALGRLVDAVPGAGKLTVHALERAWARATELEARNRPPGEAKLYPLVEADDTDTSDPVYRQGFDAGFEGRPFHSHMPHAWAVGWISGDAMRREPKEVG